jgi:hypothetical protein
MSFMRSLRRSVKKANGTFESATDRKMRLTAAAQEKAKIEAALKSTVQIVPSAFPEPA